MQIANAQSIKPLSSAGAYYPQNTFLPLAQESRTTVSTDAAAYYLNRKPQTLRAWACLENGPIRPIRISGRLAWPVSGIRALLNGEVV